MKQLIIVLSLFWYVPVFAQDPEFPKKEFVTHLRIHNGMVTNFKATMPDTYLGGIQIMPQFTIVPNRLRIGGIGGGMYTGKKLQGNAGVLLAFKLKTLNAGFFGSAGNINLSIEHLWGTEKQKLFGGGFNLDLGNKIILSALVHRDYHLNNWWLQSGIGFRLSKIKQPIQP